MLALSNTRYETWVIEIKIMGIIMDGMALTVAAVPDTSGCTQFGIYCV